MTLAEASILIVDDEPILRMTFSVLLKRGGATVHVAADGLEAIDILDREHIDMMLTDKQMPNMDGMTLLRTLYARGTVYPSLLFVNGVEQESHDEMAKLGVLEAVTKPLHPRDLLATFERALKTLSKAS
jgi:two-component system, chemotaxis family, chemotaxis protein CheY